MQVALENNIVFVVIEYFAILCWGLSGGLAAIRKGYDIFTIMLCGWLTALGGGLVRDVMLGALPPVGITDKGFVLTLRCFPALSWWWPTRRLPNSNGR